METRLDEELVIGEAFGMVNHTHIKRILEPGLLTISKDISLLWELTIQNQTITQAF